MLEQIFLLANLVVLPFWLIMIFAPHWRVTQAVMRSPAVVLPPALLYCALTIPVLPVLANMLAAPNLATIQAGLNTPLGTTAVWAHLVTFDLFVGRWAYLDSRTRQIRAVLASVALFFILMLGPLGLLLYLLLRYAYRRDQ